MRRAAVVGALIVAGAAAVTFAWRPPATPQGAVAAPGVPTEAEMQALQAQADSACRCARQPGKEIGDQGCWAGFERSLARYRHSESATMCRDESVALVCFPPFDDFENCLFRERAYRACSEEEVVRKRAEARARGDEGCGGG